MGLLWSLVEVRTGHFSLVHFPLRSLGTLSRLRLAQPQGLGTSSPRSVLESEQACESTGWITCLPFSTPFILPGPQGDVPFAVVCLPARTMTHPHFAFHPLVAGA